MMKRLFTTFAFILAFAVTPSANATDLPLSALLLKTNPALTHISDKSGTRAQNMIAGLGKTAMDAIKDDTKTSDQRKAIFKKVLSNNFDMQTIGRFAMGRYWRQTTPAQQAQYLDLYKAMIINVYTSRFEQYSGQIFDVTGHRVDESGDIVVNSVVKDPNGRNPVKVDWRVREKGKKPLVIDVMVEGVSMGVTQRNDFSGVIQKGDGTPATLIAYLQNGGSSDVKK